MFLVLPCMCVLHACVNCWTSTFKLLCSSATSFGGSWRWFDCRTSPGPLCSRTTNSSWKTFCPKRLLLEMKILLTNWCPISIYKCGCRPNGKTKWSKNKLAMFTNVFIVVVMVLFNMEYSALIALTFASCIVFADSSIISMSTNLDGPVTLTKFILRLCRYRFRFLTQLSFLDNIAYTIFNIWSKQWLRGSPSYISIWACFPSTSDILWSA